MFDTMRVTKEVHSIGPITLKFVSHCLTIAFAGDTQILLTMAYNIINSSFCTGRGSSLGKRVMATHLCSKRRVGFWISLHRGANLPWTTWPKIKLQNSCRLKPRQTFLRKTGKWSLKQRRWLKSHQSKVVFVPKKSERNTLTFLPKSARRNWFVRRREPFCMTSHPTAWQTWAKSMSISVFSRRSGSKALVWPKLRCLSMV